MKLTTNTLTLLAVSLLSTLAVASTDDVLTNALNAHASKPHSINLSLDKREKIPEVDGILDSNTAPIEDSVASGSIVKPTSNNKLKSAKNIDTPAGLGKLGSADLNSDDNTPPASYAKSYTSSSSTDVSVTSVTKSGIKMSSQDISSSDEGKQKEGSNSFLMAISMIIVSEIGDKTFLIAALMAMRNNRMVVFTASFASLAVMTVLSGIVGNVLPTLLSPRITQFLAAILFVVFGVKLTQEGLAMSKDLGVEEELAEVEEEIDMEFNDVEAGRVQQNHPQHHHHDSFLSKITNQPQIHAFFKSVQSIAGMVLSPLWIQVFIMIFLGEWGDRSQIATIAMAAGSNYWAIISGAVIGHGLCTAAAVVGGKMLATKISMRTVTLGGAFAFFVFAVLYLLEALSGGSAAEA